ncbi:AzlC family ABC transporter permease [Chelatococcus asaccharovorans]|nr:AzlC family ABC transporter permease [Chelatococcus asaccharovorans]
MTGVKEIPLEEEGVVPATAQAEWLDGLIAIAPVAAIVMPVGVLFGAVSTAKGLTVLEASLMSMLVFAGGAQIAAVDLWVAPVPIAAIVLSTFLINARHILMGVSLAPKTQAFTSRQRIAAFFFLTDEAWALSERRALHRPLTPAFWFPLALMVPAPWIAGTLIGTQLGNCLGDPGAIGADFAFTALLIWLIASFTTSRLALAAVVASSMTAALAHCAVGAPWHVVAGAIAGIAAAYASAGCEGTPRTCP